ncbi:hypothetical protein OT109_04105 [Phycisphaeraceae bacterium D3-23]
MPAQKNKPRRRRLRRLLAVLAVLLLLAGGLPLAALYWYTRPAQLKPVAQQALKDLTGCDVVVGHAEVSRDGRVHLEDVELRVPGLDGEYALLATIKTLDLFGEPRGLIDGTYAPHRVEVDGLSLRLTEDADDGTFNYEQLVLPQDTETQEAAAIPMIRLRRSAVRFGRRGEGDRVEPLGEMHIEGDLNAESLTDRLYTFALRETDAQTGQPDPQGAEFLGRFSIESPLVELTVNRFSLADEQRFFVPAEFRDYWARLAPEGDVTRLTLALGPDAQNRFSEENAKLEMELENIGLNLNILGAQDPDMREAALLLNTIETRLTGLRGKLILEGGRWRLEESTGRVSQYGIGLSPVVYHIDAQGGLGLSDPYDIAITTEPFTLKDRFEFLLAMSPLTSEGYRRFRPSGAMSLSARFTSDGSDAPPDWGIRLNLINAKMVHELFPLPITSLRGTIDITGEQVTIDGLTGETPSGAAVLLAGTATPASDIAEVDLTIDITGLPIDEHLLSVLKPNERDNLNRFLDQTAYDGLVERGLISTDGDGAPRFVLGGSVDVHVPVFRPYGEEADYSIVPVLELAGLNALMRDFPYPVTVTSGSVQVGPDFVVVDKLSLASPTGGALTVDGRADKDSDTGDYLPVLMVTDAALPADALLLAAIGGEAETLLTDLHLTGLLRIAGPIEQRTGEIDPGMTLDVVLTDASVNPFGGAVTLHNVAGALTLHGKAITDLRFTGDWRDGASLVVTGGVEWGSDDPDSGNPITEADLLFSAADFFFDDDLLDLLPADSDTRAELAELYAIYDPVGGFDAQLTWRPTSRHAPDDFEVELSPRDLALNLLGGRLSLTGITGGAHISPDLLTLHNLGGTFTDADGATGTLEADGTVTIADDPDIALRLAGETSAIGATARLLLPDKTVGVLDAIAWDGGFTMRDGRLEMTEVGGTEQATSFDATAQFAGVGMTIGGVPLTEVDATLAVVVDDTPRRDIPRMSFELDCSSLIAMDRRVTRLRGRADNHDRAEILRTTRVTGSIYGGTAIFEAAMGLGEVDRSSLRLSMHDVELDAFMEPAEVEPNTDGPGAVLERDRSLGLISGEIAITTGYGEGAPRTGRGSIRVEDASLYGDNPLGLGMVELLNFNIPTGRGFDQAAIDFSVVDETILFNRIMMQTPEQTMTGRTLKITGGGTLTFPQLALDLQLRTQSGGSSRLPFTGMFNAIRNELVGITVAGTLTEPDVSYTVLQNTRDALNELLTGRPRVGE